jgi:hypothetical protein
MIDLHQNFKPFYFLKIYLILKLDENKKIYGPIVD